MGPFDASPAFVCLMGYPFSFARLVVSAWLVLDCHLQIHGPPWCWTLGLLVIEASKLHGKIKQLLFTNVSLDDRQCMLAPRAL